MATLAPELRDSFHEFGELITELLKLVAILVFGALISPAFLGEIPALGYVFAVLALVVARPAAIAVSFLGSRLPWQQQAAVAWFGPKGFASVVYGLIVLDSDAAGRDVMFHLIALVVVLSILAHSRPTSRSHTTLPVNARGSAKLLLSTPRWTVTSPTRHRQRCPPVNMTPEVTLEPVPVNPDAGLRRKAIGRC